VLLMCCSCVANMLPGSRNRTEEVGLDFDRDAHWCVCVCLCVSLSIYLSIYLLSVSTGVCMCFFGACHPHAYACAHMWGFVRVDCTHTRMVTCTRTVCLVFVGEFAHYTHIITHVHKRTRLHTDMRWCIFIYISI